MLPKRAWSQPGASRLDRPVIDLANCFSARLPDLNYASLLHFGKFRIACLTWYSRRPGRYRIQRTCDLIEHKPMPLCRLREMDRPPSTLDRSRVESKCEVRLGSDRIHGADSLQTANRSSRAYTCPACPYTLFGIFRGAFML